MTTITGKQPGKTDVTISGPVNATVTPRLYKID